MHRLPISLALLALSACDTCPETRPPDFPREAALAVSVLDEPDAEPFLECTGFEDDGASARCASDRLTLGSTWIGGDAELVATTSPTLFGWVIRLESGVREGGRARLCRIYVTDVSSEDQCEPGYECAVSGEVLLTSGGGAIVHATFASGATIDAALAH